MRGHLSCAHGSLCELIDEYRAMIHPVLVGGGIPFFLDGGRPVDLEPVETRRLGSGVVHVRYRVVR